MRENPLGETQEIGIIAESFAPQVLIYLWEFLWQQVMSRPETANGVIQRLEEVRMRLEKERLLEEWKTAWRKEEEEKIMRRFGEIDRKLARVLIQIGGFSFMGEECLERQRQIAEPILAEKKNLEERLAGLISLLQSTPEAAEKRFLPLESDKIPFFEEFLREVLERSEKEHILAMRAISSTVHQFPEAWESQRTLMELILLRMFGGDNSPFLDPERLSKLILQAVSGLPSLARREEEKAGGLVSPQPDLASLTPFTAEEISQVAEAAFSDEEKINVKKGLAPLLESFIGKWRGVFSQRKGRELGEFFSRKMSNELNRWDFWQRETTSYALSLGKKTLLDWLVVLSFLSYIKDGKIPKEVRSKMAEWEIILPPLISLHPLIAEVLREELKEVSRELAQRGFKLTITIKDSFPFSWVGEEPRIASEISSPEVVAAVATEGKNFLSFLEDEEAASFFENAGLVSALTEEELDNLRKISFTLPEEQEWWEEFLLLIQFIRQREGRENVLSFLRRILVENLTDSSISSEERGLLIFLRLLKIISPRLFYDSLTITQKSYSGLFRYSQHKPGERTGEWRNPSFVKDNYSAAQPILTADSALSFLSNEKKEAVIKLLFLYRNLREYMITMRETIQAASGLRWEKETIRETKESSPQRMIKVSYVGKKEGSTSLPFYFSSPDFDIFLRCLEKKEPDVIVVAAPHGVGKTFFSRMVGRLGIIIQNTDAYFQEPPYSALSPKIVVLDESRPSAIREVIETHHLLRMGLFVFNNIRDLKNLGEALRGGRKADFWLLTVGEEKVFEGLQGQDDKFIKRLQFVERLPSPSGYLEGSADFEMEYVFEKFLQEN